MEDYGHMRREMENNGMDDMGKDMVEEEAMAGNFFYLFYDCEPFFMIVNKFINK